MAVLGGAQDQGWETLDESLKDIFFIKVKTLPRSPKTAHSNTPPHVYVTVWKDLHNSGQTYMQWTRVWFLFSL